MKTLYVSDLDGTLLTKEGCVPAYSVGKINRFIEEGLLFTFATARSVQSAKRAVSGLELNLPVVLYNGGLIYDFVTHEVLRSVFFEREEGEYLLGLLRGYAIEPVFFSARAGEELVRWIPERESEGTKRYLKWRTHDPRMRPAASDGELTGDHIFYLRCSGPFEQLKEAWNILKFDPRFMCIFHQETYQSDFLLEIFPREATKANGVSFLRGRLACDKVICFGDTSNDSDMFDVCDEKYAVMNADAWLKEKATGIIGYCEEDGVAKWLEQNYRS